MMKAYFEYQDEPWSELKKFDIYFKDGYYYAEEIEPPCNDRRLLCRGDSVAEVIEWLLNNT